jgi:purine-binding chemotaxis protein CheW
MADDDLDFNDEEDNTQNTYLTFQVGGEEYAVPVANVTEIVRLQRSFAVPDVPSFIKGVINLRGKVIPLLDVRSRFGLPENEYTDLTVVIVLEVGEACTGLVVDGVSEVAEIPPEQIAPRPQWKGSASQPSMIRGVGKRGESVSFLLDVDALLDVPGANDARAPMEMAAAVA